jgi:dihydrofolate reductase
MRKVVFGVASSLDSFIAREDHSVDWLLWGDEAASLMSEFWQNIDTVLMGRGTYEVAVGRGQSGGSPGVQTYVFSRTMEGVWGGVFAKSLFEDKLIDEVGLNIHPVLLGSGIPLFLDMNHEIDLELIECRPFANGCVYVSYRVKN